MTSRAAFSDPDLTAGGERRASVPLLRLRTLWFNTGTLCNITCDGCYIQSSPYNDRLAYLSRDDVITFLREAKLTQPGLDEIAFTGGEPFMNGDLPGMMRDALEAGYRVLVLTNAMRPMQRFYADLLALRQQFGERLCLRVSLDHYRAELHETLRGAQSWAPALEGLLWLARNRFNFAIAGRTPWNESEASLRAGYGVLLASIDPALDCNDPARLVLFPEMNAHSDVPEISEGCWTVLGKRPDDMMCAHARMVVKRKDAAGPVVVSCTLLPYEQAFELGGTLADADRAVKLNHRFCAEFCVLGGGSCSPPPGGTADLASGVVRLGANRKGSSALAT